MREDTFRRKKASQLFKDMGKRLAGRADGRNTFGGQARVGRDKFGVGTDGSGSDHVHGAGGDSRARLSSAQLGYAQVGKPAGVDFHWRSQGIGRASTASRG